MRVVMIAGLVGLVGVGLSAPASACPQGTRCIAMTSGLAGLSSLPAHRIETPTVVPAPALVHPRSVTVNLSEDGNSSLRQALTSFRPAVVHAEDIEMPELWVAIATVKARLPRFKTEESFSMVLSPVVVTMPTESTPGLGLSGAF